MAVASSVAPPRARAAEPAPKSEPGATANPGGTPDLFRRDNLIAWCIVPFDAKKRGPEERAEMLARLGFKRFAYDYRREHVPTFEAEIVALEKHGVSLDAWWFPGSMNDEAKLILDICRKHGVRPQLWVSGGGVTPATDEERAQRIDDEAKRIRPIAEAAAQDGLKVGLYNHGGWFGEPENQIAIIERIKLPNVGMVYNFHHGHAHVDRFAELLAKMRPHLLAVNVNGMDPAGDKTGRKILQLGQGSLELKLMQQLRDGGYTGPVGILGHTQDDAEARLADNLDGLDWLVPQLDGKPAGPKPQPRTPVPAAKGEAKAAAAADAPAGNTGGVAAGRAEYAATPITVELRATLRSARSYNILVAQDVKSSAAHWEIFTMPKTGTLTVYLPGRKPDHVRTTVDLCDGKAHDVAVTYEANRVRLFVDGREVAEEKIESPPVLKAPPNSGLAVARLVEGGLGCDGAIEYVRISRGVREDASLTKSAGSKDAPPSTDAATIGLWHLAASAAGDVPDLSAGANPLKRLAAAAVPAAGPKKQPEPSAGVHLRPVDPQLQTVLIDRSPDAVYMGVKADRDGNLFVGGREGVFLFAARPDGTFEPRRELLRFPTDSIIMGLEFRGDDLFVLTANALYYVEGGRVRREGLRPERILWGLPLDLHVSFHCLAWGDRNSLYITHGDPLLGYGDWSRPDHWGHWTLYSQPVGSVAAHPGKRAEVEGEMTAWRKTAFTGQGAVLRLNVENGQVEVVATGLRGPVGLAFMGPHHLFTNDNDHESRADQYAPAKLLHVPLLNTQVDFGWPRGWMASKSPDRFDLIEPVCDLGRGVPCDLLFYQSSYLPATFQKRLLLARWDRHAVCAYQPVSQGGTFTAVEETVVTGDDNCRPVGLAADKRGRLFVTALYMAGNMAAPYCASDLVMITRADDAKSPGDPTENSEPADLAGGIVPPITRDELFGDDPFRRQIAARHFRSFPWSESSDLLRSETESHRLAAVLIAGGKLTTPAVDYTPPIELPLFYPKENSFFKRNQFFHGANEPVDLATLSRIGSFTTAQWWAGVTHTPEQEELYAALVTAVADRSDRVRLQAAYYLSLLNDSRSESLVEKTRRDVQLRRLANAKETAVRRFWKIGPFADGDDRRLEKPHGPETGNLDLSARFGSLAWQKVDGPSPAEPSETAPDGSESSYLYFRVDSRARQSALLDGPSANGARAWINGSAVVAIPDAEPGQGEGPVPYHWIVDLQPGGNDLLLRLADHHSGGLTLRLAEVTLRALEPIEASLPDQLDSARLAERLREAAAGGAATAIAPEFLSVDWSQAALSGDAVEGRKLFGSLGCAKCHAIVPDQKSAGAPSLFEAKRRFNVPHLVESVLLPSRQVAEPFRAQAFTLDDGRSITGLVVAESAANVEVVLPDATRRTIAKPSIEERSITTLSPMPHGLVKQPAELRHLLAYLLSERPLPP